MGDGLKIGRRHREAALDALGWRDWRTLEGLSSWLDGGGPAVCAHDGGPVPMGPEERAAAVFAANEQRVREECAETALGEARFADDLVSASYDAEEDYGDHSHDWHEGRRSAWESTAEWLRTLAERMRGKGA